jgi:hypothetical protein
MIAICPPMSVEWGADPSAAGRIGSLRRIDDIVNELLAGYALAQPHTGVASPLGSTHSPRGTHSVGSTPSRGNLPPRAGATAVEMLLASER